MLTKDFAFGMNLLTLAGFVLMGIGLTCKRQGMIRIPMAFTIMGLGTALVFFGLYAGLPS